MAEPMKKANMKKADLDTRMRQREVYHNLTLVPGMWTVVRLDGRRFSRFTLQHFQKPFDERFRDAMVCTARALMQDLHGLYGWTSSDEISVLLPPEWDGFGRSIEKLLSLSASLASSTFSLQVGQAAQFDSRIWMGATFEDVLDYFMWRQEDSARCALQGWAYWTLRNAGQGARQATQTLENTDAAFKNEMLFQYGINFNETPLWQRRGIGLSCQQVLKTGFNPVTQEEVQTTRKVLTTHETLPMKQEYRLWLAEQLQTL